MTTTTMPAHTPARVIRVQTRGQIAQQAHDRGEHVNIPSLVCPACHAAHR